MLFSLLFWQYPSTCYLERAEDNPKKHNLINLIALPHLGDVAAELERYSYLPGGKQMQRVYKSQSTPRSTVPEHHYELRIGEGLLVFFLLAVLMLVLF